MTALNSYVTVEDLDFVESVLANHNRTRGGGDCETVWCGEDEQYVEYCIAVHLFGPDDDGDWAYGGPAWDDQRFQDLRAYAEATVLGPAEHILDRIAWRIEYEWLRNQPGCDGIPF